MKKKDTALITKALTFLRKMLAKEFLFVVTVIVISFPLAFLINKITKWGFSDLYVRIFKELNISEDLDFLFFYGMCLLGFYIARFISESIKSLIKTAK